MSVQPNPCETCAFRDGCETQEEPQNVLKAQICVLGALPFHCHHSPAGDWHDLDLGELNAAEHLSLAKELPICAGWKATVKLRASQGYYSRPSAERTARRYLAAYALTQLEKFLNRAGKAKTQARIELGQTIRLLKAGWKKKNGQTT